MANPFKVLQAPTHEISGLEGGFSYTAIGLHTLDVDSFNLFVADVVVKGWQELRVRAFKVVEPFAVEQAERRLRRSGVYSDHYYSIPA